MAFTGKCTFSADARLPEIAEDVSDLVGILAAGETPLLDALGDPHRAATSTRHEWLEAALIPNTDAIDDAALDDSGLASDGFGVATAQRFRAGDLVHAEASQELMLVTAVDAGLGRVSVERGYGGTSPERLLNNTVLHIVGNAALEGQEAPAARSSYRQRCENYTQIFSALVQVSGSEAAVRQLAVEDEMDFQKSCRLRELLRDLENTVINGVPHESSPLGGAGVRRSMRGIISFLGEGAFVPGADAFPADAALTEGQLNAALRTIWERSGSKVDLIVCGGAQKRRINGFITASQRFAAGSEHFKNLVSTYESDYGVCRVLLSRNVPANSVLLLDSSRLAVLPLLGRSFQVKPLAPTGDYQSAEVLGEYTLEMRNPEAHGMIRGLAV